MKTKDYRVLEGVEYENTDNEFIIDAGEVSFKVYIFCEFDLAFDYIEGERETGNDPWCDLRWADTWWPHGRTYDNGIRKPFLMGDGVDIKGMSLTLVDADKPNDDGNLLFDYDATKEGCLSNALRGEVDRWMNFTFSGSTLYERICDEIEQAKEERMTFDRTTQQRVYKKLDIRWEEIAYESTKNL
tara:strand:- start:164 stop:721 length:558 start_codon:yes stop_codon:yes gene_type:complete